MLGSPTIGLQQPADGLFPGVLLMGNAGRNRLKVANPTAISVSHGQRGTTRAIRKL